MLSVGSGATAEYYLESQAEYYSAGTEPLGEWYNGPGHFGLADGSAVDADAWKTLYRGFAPTDGRALVQNAGADKRRGAIDLTFSADKSVSAVWAVASPEMRAEIEAAQAAAVRAALDVVQDHAAETRRGKGGAIREPVTLWGGLFQHGDTRSGDPELHTHAVLLNVAERRDGTWGSIANEQIFRWKMAAGATYRSELAAQLQDRLGLAIEAHGDRHEFFRLSGVPQDLCADWSKRRKALEAEAEKLGFDLEGNAARAAGVVVKIRGKKIANDGRDEKWAAEAAAKGFSTDHAEQLRGAAPAIDPSIARNAAWSRICDAVREHNAHESVFTEAKLHQLVAEAATGTFASRDIPGLNRRLEAEGVVVRLTHPVTGQEVFATRRAVEDEVAVRALARAAQKDETLTVEPLDQMYALLYSKTGLNSDQIAAGKHLMGSQGGIVLVEGAPGVGKTTLLAPVVDGYRRAGASQVLATAIAWRQANDLASIGADQCLAADKLLYQYRAGKLQIDKATVIVVDELGQWSASQARQLLELQRATGCRVIGLGDRHQQQAVGAGPGMALMAAEAKPVEVREIVRQTDEAARQAVTDLRAGNAADAVKAHRERGMIIEAASREQAICVAADKWVAFRSGGQSTAVIAERWTDVREISTEIRERLRAAGEIGADAVTVKATGSKPGRPVSLVLAVGDQVRFKRKDDSLRVVNGDTARIVAINDGGQITVRIGDRHVVVPTTYQDEHGHVPLSHAYAATLAGSQGMSIEKPVAFGKFRAKEAATVALSRNTGHNWTTVIIDRSEIEAEIRDRRPEALWRDPVTTADIDSELAKAWSKSGAKASALDYIDEQTLERWITDWDGQLPSDALASGQQSAEVANLADFRAKRQQQAAAEQQRQREEQEAAAKTVAEAAQRREDDVAGRAVEGDALWHVARDRGDYMAAVAAIAARDAAVAELRAINLPRSQIVEADFARAEQQREEKIAAAEAAQRREDDLAGRAAEGDALWHAARDRGDYLSAVAAIAARDAAVAELRAINLPRSQAVESDFVRAEQQWEAKMAAASAAAEAAQRLEADAAKERDRQDRLAAWAAQITQRESKLGLTQWSKGAQGSWSADVGDLTLVVDGPEWAMYRGKTLLEQGTAKGPRGARDQAVTAVEELVRQEAQNIWERYWAAAQHPGAIIAHNGHLQVADWAADDLYDYPERAGFDRVELDALLQPLKDAQWAADPEEPSEQDGDGPEMG